MDEGSGGGRQVQLADLGRRPQVARVMGKRKNELSEIITKTSSYS